MQQVFRLKISTILSKYVKLHCSMFRYMYVQKIANSKSLSEKVFDIHDLGSFEETFKK